MTQGVITAVYARRLDSLALTKALSFGAIVNHCGVVVPDPERNGELVVVEAVHRLPGPLFPLINGRVVKTPLDEWHARYPWTATRQYPVKDQLAGESFALSTVGCKYDVEWFIGVHWKSDWDDPEKWGCSEHLAMTWIESGSPRFYEDKTYVSPMDCWMAV